MEKGQIHPIQVVISSRFPKLTNLKASSKPNRANLINVPILSSLSESRFSNNSIGIYFYLMPVLSVLQSSDLKLIFFILDQQIDVFFIDETWLKGVGDEAKIAKLTPSGYAMRYFSWANRDGCLAVIAQRWLSCCHY